MARAALLPAALVTLVVLAGCSGGIPGVGTTSTPADVDARIDGTYSSGGACVEDPTHGFVVESTPNDDGTRSLTVEANVTVPGAHYTIDGSPTLTETGPTAYRLDVNTTASDEKPEKPCEHGGIVHYQVSMTVPDTDTFALEIRHDGEPVSGVGSGADS